MPQEQLALPVPGDESSFRLVHYLGSKLRAIDAIRSIVEDVVPTGGRVCDLFAGSGAVSLGLRHRWATTSVDIQEYSRVLCSAVLTQAPDRTRSGFLWRDRPGYRLLLLRPRKG